jgi:hypothetical protein
LVEVLIFRSKGVGVAPQECDRTATPDAIPDRQIRSAIEIEVRPAMAVGLAAPDSRTLTRSGDPVKVILMLPGALPSMMGFVTLETIVAVLDAALIFAGKYETPQTAIARVMPSAAKRKGRVRSAGVYSLGWSGADRSMGYPLALSSRMSPAAPI